MVATSNSSEFIGKNRRLTMFRDPTQFLPAKDVTFAGYGSGSADAW
jgi:hypothetical protein